MWHPFLFDDLDHSTTMADVTFETLKIVFVKAPVDEHQLCLGCQLQDETASILLLTSHCGSSFKHGHPHGGAIVAIASGF